VAKCPAFAPLSWGFGEAGTHTVGSDNARINRPFTLRLTLAFLVLAAAAYVAAISIYIAVQIAPTAAALQDFRQETTVRHDTSERLLTLDSALRDARELVRNATAPPEQVRRKVAELQAIVRQLADRPDERSGLSTLPPEIRTSLVQAVEAEGGLSAALRDGLVALQDRRFEDSLGRLDAGERLRKDAAAHLDKAYSLELDDLATHHRGLRAASHAVVMAVRWWLIGVVLFTPLVAWFVHRRLYRPLSDLDAGMARVRDGDLDTAIHVHRADELGRLGQHFNNMTAVLRERAADERQRAERKTQYLQEQLIERERLAALGRMAGAIAHEVGTPLTSVLGYTQLLAKEPLSERGRQRVKIIESQVQRMAEIIQTYLARTRGAPSERRPIQVNELVRGTLDQLRLVLRRAGLKIAFVERTEPPPIVGDLDGLHRVLVNLIQNAADAMPDGGEITITTDRIEPPQAPFRGVVIDVADTGLGIAPELLPKIFDLFFTTKPQGRGTGMGLAICHEIVKAHRGRIDVVSEVGKGTRMRVLLPLEGSTDVEAHTADRG
jgi:signal transduction histidine kinase